MLHAVTKESRNQIKLIQRVILRLSKRGYELVTGAVLKRQTPINASGGNANRQNISAQDGDAIIQSELHIFKNMRKRIEKKVPPNSVSGARLIQSIDKRLMLGGSGRVNTDSMISSEENEKNLSSLVTQSVQTP